MTRLRLVTFSALALFAGACSDTSNSPTTVNPSPLLAQRADGGTSEDPGTGARIVRIRDECDPASFNAAFNDPNICIRSGSITFDHFIAELTQTRQAPQWRFDPGTVELDPARGLLAVNNGGEVHTFTRVAKFGGGIIPLLNTLTGQTDVAPECTTLEADDFVAPGGTYTAELNTDALQHFQCCIHPWMRTDVRVES